MRLAPTNLRALGDVRALGQGDTITLSPALRALDDWPRYVEAIAAAISKGASVQWTEESTS